MKLANLSSELPCNPSSNIYNCRDSHQFRLVVIFNLLGAFSVFATALSVILYRWRGGLFCGIYRRVGKHYWLPNAIDSFMACLAMGELLRTIKHIVVLSDSPKLMLFRDTLNMTVTVLDCLAVAMFTTGIIGHIPLEFTYSESSSSLSLPSSSCDDATAQPGTWDKLRIFVPRTALLFWMSCGFFTQMVVVNVGIGVWLGWTKDHGLQRMASIAEKTEALCMAASILAILVVNIYYCFGFYRILYTLASLTGNYQSQTGITSQMSAARRYRNIFLTVVILFSISSCFAIFIGIFSQQINHNTIASMIVSLLQFSILYPIFGLTVLYNIWQTSRLQMRRSNRNRRDLSDTREHNNILTTTTTATATTTTNMQQTFSTATDKTPTLVWQTFIAGHEGNDTVDDRHVVMPIGKQQTSEEQQIDDSFIGY
ncbi:hypothetical protein BDF22DRAFT_700833 [Syncephalis plumigaleata]|nr:hypothetical protein BDF22DRAFT_700833 [Syncephalis plumigaleata]